ncbi:hypothetical protein GCM10009678_10080 [Actinomadura kijaniata]|uniref:Uncharacterized protein n=1 Tax=Actinomadura namibiensis TaxID=182080 RepID=A0A7W3LJJ8_ACTNM|nr:hypothetical protein [Actinomadura namibiensis]MBA8949253.1 hypothetical protein [Actinomadura namibiensis]
MTKPGATSETPGRDGERDRPGVPGAPSGKRVTVNLTGKAARALEDVQEITGYNATDSINRALQVYAYLEELTRDGGELLYRDGGGRLERIRFL